MNNQERLKSHKRMYSWIKEKAINGCTFYDEDDSDWAVIENRYPELLTLVEDLISNVETLVNREQELLLSDIKFDEVIGTVYWWTKEPDDVFVDEENIVEKIDKTKLRIDSFTNKMTSEQVEYISGFMDSEIDIDEYDYYFEYR